MKGVFRHLVVLQSMLISFYAMGQQVLEGNVTFVTADQVYVHFGSTTGIEVGDTLELANTGNHIPCLLVIGRSSASCSCRIIGRQKIERNDRVIFEHGAGKDGHSIPAEVIYVPRRERRTGRRSGGGRIRYHESLGERGMVPEDSNSARTSDQERIKARLSAATYGNFNTPTGDDHRMVYRLASTAEHIAGSMFSGQVRMDHRDALGDGPLPPSYRRSNIHELAVRVDPDPTFTCALGRKINANVSSLGALDGLQAEKHLGRWYGGMLVGSRPDVVTNSFSPQLLEYGGYLGNELKSPRSSSKTTLGVLQQNNSGLVDRRYAYFQHASTFDNVLNVFSSFELDLFRGPAAGGPRLTSLMLTARYRFGNRADLSVSYDNRRRIVYYETYRTELERLLEDDEARQGARARLSLKPFKGVVTGIALSKRFQSSGENPSDNFNAFLNVTNHPKTWGRWFLQGNRNASSYMRSDVLSIRHSRSLMKGKLDVSLYYRRAIFTYMARPTSENLPGRTMQLYYGVDLAYTITPTLMITLLGELSTSAAGGSQRLNTCIIKRFDSKKRKR